MDEKKVTKYTLNIQCLAILTPPDTRYVSKSLGPRRSVIKIMEDLGTLGSGLGGVNRSQTPLCIAFSSSQYTFQNVLSPDIQPRHIASEGGFKVTGLRLIYQGPFMFTPSLYTSLASAIFPVTKPLGFRDRDGMQGTSTTIYYKRKQ